MTRFRWYGPSLVLLCTALLVMVMGPGVMRSLVYAQEGARLQLIRNDLVENPTLEQLSNAFKQVAQLVEPSVVHIEVQGRPSAQQMGMGPGGPNMQGLPEELRRFFDPFQQQPQQEQPQTPQDNGQFDKFNPYRAMGNGSGWVYRHTNDAGESADYIVTNNHVVENAERIVVRFQDGREAVAEIVGEPDPQTDVAVLRLKGDMGTLHPAAVSQSPVEQGEMVFAFGSPFRFDFSMSQGIVSATGRSRVGILGRDGYENFIQTDAAINPGNSGGPLVNIRGEVIGMNTAIASRDGGFNGLGFAIPVSMATTIADAIIEDGKVQRGFLGIEIVDLTQDWADSFKYDSTDGALVMNVLPGGAAANADIKPGDIITAVGDKAIHDVVELRSAIAAIKPGKPIDVKLFRDGKTQTVSVTLGSRTDVQMAGNTGSDDAPEDMQAGKNERLLQYGMTGVETLTPERAEEIGVEYQPGVLVTSLREGSVAAGNLQRGALITDVFDQKVATVTELTEAINASQGDKPLRLKVMLWDRQNERWNTAFVLMKLPEM